MKTILLSCFTAMLCGCLLAQNNIPTPTLQSRQGVDEMTTLQLPLGNLTSLLQFYEVTSGKILIRDSQLAEIQNIQLVVAGEIPKSQALRLVESVLTLNGVTLIPGADNSVKVLGTGKPPRSEGVPVYSNLADLPKGDQVVSYFMALRFISANEALQIFQNTVPPHPQYGVYVPVPHAQAIIISDNASTIRQVAAVKELIDVPPAKVLSKFVVLQRADAERVAEIITKLIESRKSKQAAAGNPPGTGANNPDPSQTMNERSLISGDVELIPDARTNRILVVTRPVNFDYIKALIDELDNAVVLSPPLERSLKYVMASEVLPVLVTLLSDNDDNQSGTGQPDKATNRQNQRQPSVATEGNEGRISTEKTLSENEDTSPEAVMVGKIRLIADKQANSIIVIGPPESQERVRTILDRLDKKPMQVYLSTVIGQLTVGKNSEFAVDLLQKYSKSGDFGVASASVTRGATAGAVFTPEPSILNTAGAFANAISGLTVYGTIGSALEYYVHALESTSRFKVISRPVIYTQNNKVAVISSGQRIPYSGQSLSTLNTGIDGQAAVASNTDFVNVELKLEVLPLINSKGEVTLQIKQTNDSVVGNRVISGNVTPTIGTQFIDTTVSVPNRSIVVLGGLVSEDSSVNVTGIPILKDIPILGYLFKGTTKDKTRTELIIMIQPVVVDSEAEEATASLNEERRAEIGPDSREFSKQSITVKDAKEKTQNAAPLKSSAHQNRSIAPVQNLNAPGGQ